MDVDLIRPRTHKSTRFLDRFRQGFDRDRTVANAAKVLMAVSFMAMATWRETSWRPRHGSTCSSSPPTT